MNVDKFSKILGVVLASIAFLGLGIFFIYCTATNPEKSTEGWIPTEAVVTDVQVDTDPKSMTTLYKVWIMYYDQNGGEHPMFYGHDRGYSVGDKIQIKYDPNDPNMFADINASTINAPLFGYIGIGLVVIGVLIPSVYVGVNLYNKKKNSQSKLQ